MSFKCCPCCAGVALTDHVAYGGFIEVDDHDSPCTIHDEEEEADLRSKIEELCKPTSGKVWSTRLDEDGFVFVKDIRAVLEGS